MSEPEASRFTLSPAEGLKISHFALGLLGLVAIREAKLGERITFVGLSDLTGVSVETLRALLFGGEPRDFDATTLWKIAEPFGANRWEDLVVKGKRFQTMDLQGDDDEHDP